MSDSNADIGSLLGKGSQFNGKLTFFGSVRIEGRFQGEIYSEDTLVVSSGGQVSGKITVGSLIVTGGLVEAEVVAKESVELHPPGQLKGQVTTPLFQIEKGAVFQGQSLMPIEENPPETNPPETNTESVTG